MVQSSLEAQPKAKTILVCDDEPHIVRLIQVRLERAGHKVLPCFDGKAALEHAREDKPDLIILDLMMPGLTGMQVLKRLTSDPVTAGVPVVMLSVCSEDKEVFEAYKNGAYSYLTKPFNPMELLRVIA